MLNFEQIYKLIQNGDIKEALKQAIEIGRELDGEYQKEINALSSRFNMLDRNRRQNIISYEEYNLENTRAIKSLQDLLEQYRDWDNDASSMIDNQVGNSSDIIKEVGDGSPSGESKKHKYKGILGALLLVLLLIVSYFYLENQKQERCIKKSGLQVYLKKKDGQFSQKNISKAELLEIVDCKYCQNEMFRLDFKLGPEYMSSYDGLRFNLSRAKFMDKEGHWTETVEGWEKKYPGTNGRKFDYELKNFYANDVSFEMDLRMTK